MEIQHKGQHIKITRSDREYCAIVDGEVIATAPTEADATLRAIRIIDVAAIGGEINDLIAKLELPTEQTLPILKRVDDLMLLPLR